MLKAYTVYLFCLEKQPWHFFVCSKLPWFSQSFATLEKRRPSERPRLIYAYGFKAAMSNRRPSRRFCAAQFRFWLQ